MVETAYAIVAGETGCTLEQARNVIASLMHSGWAAPGAHSSEQHPSPDPMPKQPTSDLAVDPDSPLVAHTDGACSGNPGPGGWAVVFSQDGKVVRKHFGHEAVTTNNRMELTAIREAIRLAPPEARLEIATDSQNAIGWLSKGWKRNEPPIAAICREIDQLRAARASAQNGAATDISFRWVRGHDGDALNEMADRLATGAIRKAT
jgi:ribonuclease HI